MLEILSQKLKALQEEAFARLASESWTEQTLEAFKIYYLGRQGRLTHILKEIGKLSAEERPVLGSLANEVKKAVSEKIEALQSALKKKRETALLDEEIVDITFPGRVIERGTVHPITQTLHEIVSIFSGQGFQVAEGPEIELEYYNFDALNTPKDHPARDMQDTFYISEGVVLRTHTSPVQIRVMEMFKPPVRIIAPGVVYRHDDDVSHTPMFHQVEGLLVDKGISMAHLKGTLTAFIHSFFTPSTKIRFRPSYFPFTEPSAELDIQCFLCQGKGCRVCKQGGWIEVLGCGMVHPHVFKEVDYDSEIYTGFAFGMGVDRLTMLRYHIDDIRLLFENDLRFLRQF